MKTLFTFFFSLIAFVSLSQIGPYASFNAGFALPFASDVVGVKTVTSTSGDLTETNIYGSYGTGVNATLKVGFKQTQNFGVELGTNYLYGLSKLIQDDSGPNSQTTVKTTNTLIKIMPGVVLETSNSALTVYSRLGFVIPISGATYSDYMNQVTTGSSTNETIIKSKSTGAMSLGFYGGVGVSLKIGEKLKVFGEAELTGLSIKQKSSMLTTYTVDGNDILPSLDTRDKETEYKDSFNSADNFESSQPRTARAQKINYNSLSFNIGIRFNFLNLK